MSTYTTGSNVYGTYFAPGNYTLVITPDNGQDATETNGAIRSRLLSVPLKPHKTVTAIYSIGKKYCVADKHWHFTHTQRVALFSNRARDGIIPDCHHNCSLWYLNSAPHIDKSRERVHGLQKRTVLQAVNSAQASDREMRMLHR
jgi:hypothetical protein